MLIVRTTVKMNTEIDEFHRHVAFFERRPYNGRAPVGKVTGPDPEAGQEIPHSDNNAVRPENISVPSALLIAFLVANFYAS